MPPRCITHTGVMPLFVPTKDLSRGPFRVLPTHRPGRGSTTMTSQVCMITIIRTGVVDTRWVLSTRCQQANSPALTVPGEFSDVGRMPLPNRSKGFAGDANRLVPARGGYFAWGCFR